ncbi:hypothetical protein RJT34_31104 [Clitoria ternatea]|uniref:Uncharacterized protein n=1 Tax=Clitoria ternatea TaxID=43366 RepID=A0AAN9I123_CLITE
MPAIGAAGGLLCMWDKGLFKKDRCLRGLAIRGCRGIGKVKELEEKIKNLDLVEEQGRLWRVSSVEDF